MIQDEKWCWLSRVWSKFNRCHCQVCSLVVGRQFKSYRTAVTVGYVGLPLIRIIFAQDSSVVHTKQNDRSQFFEFFRFIYIFFTFSFISFLVISSFKLQSLPPLDCFLVNRPYPQFFQFHLVKILVSMR